LIGGEKALPYYHTGNSDSRRRTLHVLRCHGRLYAGIIVADTTVSILEAKLEQPQGHVQVLLNILRGFSAQAALDAPRFCISPVFPEKRAENGGEAGEFNSEVYLEDGIPLQTAAELRGVSPPSFPVSHTIYFQGMGHIARQVSGFGRSVFGRGQIIQRIVDTSGRTVWAAGSDPRADGHVAAQI
jgi:gamma-glutamyltranspeptidase / glutathione hydrolase